MRARPLALLLLPILALSAACQGGQPASTASSPLDPTAGDATPSPAGTADVVDLSAVDACTLVDDGTIQALLGIEDELTTDQSENTHCFWGVARPAVPQYLEIRLLGRPDGLAGYTWTPGEGCASEPISGVGSEAVGGTCTTPQRKVYVLAWDRGVAVQLLVNEAPASVTPAVLAATGQAVLDSLE